MDTSGEPVPGPADGTVPAATTDGHPVVAGRAANPATGRVHSPDRISTLADGVFAIAMTLLALEIQVPDSVTDEQQFRDALGPLLGALGVFALAFFVAAQYWLGHHRMMSHVHTIDGAGLGMTVAVLMGVAALPVAASLITSWSRFPEAVAVAAVILIATSLLSLRLYSHLLRPEFADIAAHERRRMLVAPAVNIAVYAVSIPAAFLLPHFGVSSAWAAVIWGLLILNRPTTNLIAGRAAAA